MTEALRPVLIQQCMDIIQGKIAQIQESVGQAEDSLFNETKSSAGDKYETSREMIQQDLDRLQKQLAESNKDRIVLDSLHDTIPLIDRVISGSLVQTNVGIYFIAIGIGRVSCDGKEVFVISPQSPIGKLLLGKKVGGTIVFNGREQTIKAIV